MVRVISAESIYRCMLLLLDHILYRRAHFVHNAIRALQAVLAMIKDHLFFYPVQKQESNLNFTGCQMPHFMIVLILHVCINIPNLSSG